jgi:hypothetical protein
MVSPVVNFIVPPRWAVALRGQVRLATTSSTSGTGPVAELLQTARDFWTSPRPGLASPGQRRVGLACGQKAASSRSDRLRSLQVPRGRDRQEHEGPTGPDPKLSAVQLASVEQALLQGAKANGFDTDLWTFERIGVVITQLTGSGITPGTCGRSCATGWAGACNALSDARSSGTSRRSPAGSPTSGHGSKRGPRRIGLDRLLGRIGRLASPAGASIRAARPGGAPIYIILDNLPRSQRDQDPGVGGQEQGRAVFHPGPRLLSQPDRGTLPTAAHLRHRRSNHPNHTVTTRALQAYLRWRNANARHPDVLAAQRREHARVRSERHHLWGQRPAARAA